MLCSIQQLDGFQLAASDGVIGHARELYFDDEQWVVRHVVADTGGWLSVRKVLISPHAIVRIDAARRQLDVALSRRQIQDAPGIDTDRPVTRQQEIPYYDHYGYPYYWAGSGLWGVEALPQAGEPLLGSQRGAGLPDEVAEAIAVAERAAADGHLRSSAEVIGYDVEASDGAIGHIADFLFDDRSWQIRYAVVDTRHWLPGRRVLVPPRSIINMDWNKRRAHFQLTRATVEASPPYRHGTAPTREYEASVQRHYEGWL